MKKILFTATALMIWVGAMAVPARPRVHTVVQSDGSTVELRKVGDEWHHSTVTVDGYRVARTGTGDYCYVTSAGTISNVMAHSASSRSASEQSFVTAQAQRFGTDKKSVRRAQAKSGRTNLRRRASQVPNMGSPRVPIVLVEFSDVKFSQSDTETLSYFNNQFSGNGAVSCYQYFYDQSEGQYSPCFDIIGPVTVDARLKYGGNDNDGNDQGLDSLVIDACNKLSDVNWKLYDNDNNGEVDVVVFLYAGVGEASSYEEESIWPCQWDMVSATSIYDEDGNVTKEGSPYKTASGVIIDKFAVFNEMNGAEDDNPGDIDGIGTFCHEFSHCLGLPDWYATNYSEHFGMGNWSILDNGCYNNEGFTPCGYTAYEKDFMGWKSLEEGQMGRYSLEATLLPAGKGIKVTSDSDPNEYYILENRQLVSWDAYLPAHGLQVTHVYYDADAWENNYVNNYDTRRMTIIPADNNLTMEEYWGSYYYVQEDMVGDLFPYNGNTELTDESVPAATTYTGSGLMGKPITNITDEDGIVTFDLMKPIREVPVLNEATEITGTSFTASWNAVDEAVSYTLRVRERSAAEMALLLDDDWSSVSGKTGMDYGTQLDDYLPSKGWTGSKIYLDGDGVRLATGKAAGTLTSPALDVDGEGKITIVVTAKSYGSDGNVPLAISTSKGKNSITINGASKSYTAVVDAADFDKVTFTSQAKQRAILTKMTIYRGDVSEDLLKVQARVASEDRDTEGQVLISGIEGTSYTVTGLTPLASYSFDVRAIFGDDDESKFSEAKFVTLLEDAGNPYDVNEDGAVNAGDVSTIYNVMLGIMTNSRADVNNDGAVNAGDVSTLYGVMLSK